MAEEVAAQQQERRREAEAELAARERDQANLDDALSKIAGGPGVPLGFVEGGMVKQWVRSKYKMAFYQESEGWPLGPMRWVRTRGPRSRREDVVEADVLILRTADGSVGFNRERPLTGTFCYVMAAKLADRSDQFRGDEYVVYNECVPRFLGQYHRDVDVRDYDVEREDLIERILERAATI